MSKMITLHRDALSHGQIVSKLWLCETVEHLHGDRQPLILWLYGGWYAVFNLLLRTRNILPVRNVVSFDIDPEATQIARMINNTWECEGSFRAVSIDCNIVDPAKPSLYESDFPDLIINTASEHFEQTAWFDAIPLGVSVAIQSNDMAHEQHCATVASQDELAARYRLSVVEFLGTKDIVYPTMSYRRFMLIGRK